MELILAGPGDWLIIGLGEWRGLCAACIIGLFKGDCTECIIGEGDMSGEGGATFAGEEAGFWIFLLAR